MCVVLCAEAHSTQHQRLEKALEAARKMLTSETERLTQVFESCREKFGPGAREKEGR